MIFICTSVDSEADMTEVMMAAGNVMSEPTLSMEH